MTGTLHIVLAMKPLDGNFVQNALKHGVAGLNIGGTRISGNEDTARPQGKDIRGGNWSGDGGRSTLTTGGGTGRWPANVILEDNEGVLGNLKRTIRNGCKDGGIWSDSTGSPAGSDYGDSGSAARFFKQVKAQ
jgi:hypothetical protein